VGGAMSILNIGNYDHLKPQKNASSIPSAGKATQYVPARGKFIPPSRVAQQRDEAVGLGSRDVFYYGAPALKPRGQYMQASKYLNPGQGNVLVPNVAEPSFTTLYQNDFSESSFDRSAFKQQNSVEAAFGKIPKGGFIKAHNAEEEPGDPHPVEIKYIYGDRNPLRLGDDPNPERPMRKAVDYAQEGMERMSQAKERAQMRTLNFAELPGQELNPKPMRKNNEQFGDRHKISQITWAYHG
jgi:hypothetical protein